MATGFQPGDVLGGKYRLVGRVAEGGMGSVWLGRHLLLDRPCAVKVLNAASGSRPARGERFAREARIAASLRHRHVVDLFDFGEAQGGEFFMVMQWLEGESLAQRLSRSPAMPLRELVLVVADCLLGLAAVHEQGIVHRDLKPENIFLAREGNEVVPKILDFGVSRLRGLPGPSITATGSTVGTPHYMSCEQVRGRRDLDGRSDLYSLGVMLFRAVSGRFPFEAEELTELLMMVAEGSVPRLLPLRLEVGEALLAVIDRATERQRENRFASAADMRRALLAAAESIPADQLSRWSPDAQGSVFDAPEAPAGSWGATPSAPGTPFTGSAPGPIQWRRLIPVGLAALVVGTAWLLMGP